MDDGYRIWQGDDKGRPACCIYLYIYAVPVYKNYKVSIIKACSYCPMLGTSTYIPICSYAYSFVWSLHSSPCYMYYNLPSVFTFVLNKNLPTAEIKS